MNSKVAQFRRLHEQRPLILPNAWDAASARVIESAGAQAIATTSAAVSWTHGRRDGQTLRREEMMRVIQSIAEAVSVPVTADLEGGYGDVPETVRAVIAAGAAGINLEDSPGRDGQTLLTPEQHAERIRAARAQGDLVINARVDVYLLQAFEPSGRFDEAVRRANLYRAAGADCLFVPGVIDAGTISRLVRAIDGPLNIMTMPSAPTVPDLGRLGVARVSVGPFLALAALAATRRAALELLGPGTYGALAEGLPFGEVNGMFDSR
jgi:2-methylisocitrate lyase-like PEP mutase family enzyme